VCWNCGWRKLDGDPYAKAPVLRPDSDRTDDSGLITAIESSGIDRDVLLAQATTVDDRVLIDALRSMREPERQRA
jgi:hypothetical protein